MSAKHRPANHPSRNQQNAVIEEAQLAQEAPSVSESDGQLTTDQLKEKLRTIQQQKAQFQQQYHMALGYEQAIEQLLEQAAS